MRWVLLATLVSLGLAASVQAATAGNIQSASPDGLALGFDKLRWDLTPEQVKSLFPALTPLDPEQEKNTDQHAYSISNYSYAGCKVTVTLFFTVHSYQLDELDFDARDLTALPCRDRVRAELVAQYRRYRRTKEVIRMDGKSIIANRHIMWVGPLATVIYNGFGDQPCRERVYDGLCGISMSVRFIKAHGEPIWVRDIP